eukprot:jgi/Hompol1/586/HPOL_005361-RA
MADSTNFFAGNPLNRQSSRRSSPAGLAHDREERGVYLPFRDLKMLWKPATKRLAHLTASELLQHMDHASLAARAVYLGLDEASNVPYWAIDPSIGEFTEVRPGAFALPRHEAAMVAQARSIIDWNSRYQYCSGCGTKTSMGDAGYKRICPNSSCIAHKGVQSFSYPRTDAVVIIAVSSIDGSKILLGRQEKWPEKMYSCIAGFMESGETIEEACRRECIEETNIRLGPISYHSSQPWPFPSQLMIGCMGSAVSEDISLADDELQDAKWFSRQEVTDAIDGVSSTLKMPSPASIAYQLVSTWARQVPPAKM